MSDDDDDPSSPPQFEPHLKKARYVWQVKGRSVSEDQRPCCSRYLQDAASSSGGSSSSSSTGSSTGSSRLDDHQDEERSCRMVIAWRAHHLAKAVFDNTINTMIENLSFPLPEFGNIMDGYSSARRDSSLEDQAVRMAIRSHGLQKPCTCPRQLVPHVPCHGVPVPFHHRTDSSIFGGPSTSSAPLRQPEPVEQDILSEAVNVAILSKGLGASPGGI